MKVILPALTVLLALGLYFWSTRNSQAPVDTPPPGVSPPPQEALVVVGDGWRPGAEPVVVPGPSPIQAPPAHVTLLEYEPGVRPPSGARVIVVPGPRNVGPKSVVDVELVSSEFDNGEGEPIFVVSKLELKGSQVQIELDRTGPDPKEPMVLVDTSVVDSNSKLVCEIVGTVLKGRGHTQAECTTKGIPARPLHLRVKQRLAL